MDTQLVRYHDVEVIDAPEVVFVEDKIPFGAMFNKAFRRMHSAQHQRMLAEWVGEYAQFLDAKTAISGSQSTRRTYITALDTFWEHIKCDPLMVFDDRRRLAYARRLASEQVLPDEYRDPWTINASIVQEYRLWLEDTGRSPATISHYLAVGSSFYQFVIDKSDVDDGGRETCLFRDADGNVRRNPFRNRSVQRPKVKAYGKVRSLTPGEVQAFMRALQEEPRALVKARDMALFLTYLLTGRRASEIVTLKWGDIAPGDEPNSFQFRFVGKGHGRGKGEHAEWEWQVLPAPCYYAIHGWLRMAGKLETITADTFIFCPIEGKGKNFGSDLPENRHVAPRRVGQLMDKIAQRAGLEKMHPHMLRHTFAHHLYRATLDKKLVQSLLGHAQSSTTDLYIGELEREGDTYSVKLMAQLGLNF